jgi:hypothetical protein
MVEAEVEAYEVRQKCGLRVETLRAAGAMWTRAILYY